MNTECSDSEFHKFRLTLIDFGLAEFYFPQKSYHVRVGSRYFKPPELLLNIQKYNYSLDVWAAGAIFAALVWWRWVEG